MIEVRSATVADVALCERIEPTYRTRHVWKVEHQVGEGLFSVAFRRARLPQEMPVEAPHGGDDLFALWQRSRCFMVAEDGHMVVGYLVLYPRQESDAGWVSHLLVAAGFERSAAATRLLESAEAWGRRQRLTSITVPAQSRNDPLIQLLMQRGYALRGFMEAYFGHGEAALLFSLTLQA